MLNVELIIVSVGCNSKQYNRTPAQRPGDTSI